MKKAGCENDCESRMCASSYEKMILEKVAAEIKEGRISLNLTQQELADRAGVSREDINRLENTTTSPTLRTLGYIAKGLNMSLSFHLVKEGEDIDHRNPSREASKVLSDVLSDELIKNNLSLDDLSKKVGLSRRTTTNLFMGKDNPRIKTICRLAESLKMEPRISFVPKFRFLQNEKEKSDSRESEKILIM